MKGIQNLISQSSIKPQIQIAFTGAIESNQIEIVRFLLHFWQSHENTMFRASFNDLLRLAYQRNHREISMILLQGFSSNDEKRWKLLFELISLEEQKQQQQPTIDQHHLIDHLFSLTSIDYLSHNEKKYFEFFSNPKSLSTNLVKNELNYNRMAPLELLNRIIDFPKVVPPIITNELEISLNKLEISQQSGFGKTITSFLSYWKACWSAFIGDFELFKALATNWKILWVYLI